MIKGRSLFIAMRKFIFIVCCLLPFASNSDAALRLVITKSQRQAIKRIAQPFKGGHRRPRLDDADGRQRMRKANVAKRASRAITQLERLALDQKTRALVKRIPKTKTSESLLDISTQNAVEILALFDGYKVYLSEKGDFVIARNNMVRTNNLALWSSNTLPAVTQKQLVALARYNDSDAKPLVVAKDIQTRLTDMVASSLDAENIKVETIKHLFVD